MKTGNDHRPIPAAKTAKPVLNPEFEDILESTINIDRDDGELFLGWGHASTVEEYEDIEGEYQEEFEEDSW